MASQRGSDWATGKTVNLAAPEEQVRQEFEKSLYHDSGYSKEYLDIEVPIQRGSIRGEKADIVVYDSDDSSKRDQHRHIWGIVETKRKNRRDGVQQLTSYMTATSCRWGVWTNGNEIEFLYKEPESGRIEGGVIFEVPKCGTDIEGIGAQRYEDLQPASNLKPILRRLLNELYSNTNISRREKLGNEMIKLMFCKLYDESNVTGIIPRFRVSPHDSRNSFRSMRERINELFESVKEDLAGEGVFEDHDRIQLENRSVAYVVGELQRFSLIQTDEDVVGNAFEVFCESKFAGEKGEFFTPREIVKTAICVLDPQPGQTIMDPACGSGGFLIAAIQDIWGKMDSHPRWKRQSPTRLSEAKKQMAKETIFGIDKESDLVRIAKAYMAIIGDGKSQIAQANSLHRAEDIEGLAKNVLVNEDGSFKQFDIIITNPPFGSKNTKVAAAESKQFDLGHKWKKQSNGSYVRGRKHRSTPAQELFIERCLELLKPGGKMAIILPETIAHGPSKKYIVQFIQSQAAIIAVIDLPHNTFRPHCNAKTLLWILEKGAEQGDIVFGIAEEMGRDHLGKIKYRIVNERVSDIEWNDTVYIRDEWREPDNPNNRYVFSVGADDISNNIFVPRHYWGQDRSGLDNEAAENGWELVEFGALVDADIVKWHRGHGSPASAYKGHGTVPYVRAGDIGNWRIYKNPKSAIPHHEYERLKKGGGGSRVRGFDLCERRKLSSE